MFDSLEAVHARYMRAINVLEGLLQGSDKWIRALETMSTEVSDVTGIWIESWNPSGGGVEVSGNATTRDHVVDLAERLSGTISSLTFSEIRLGAKAPPRYRSHRRGARRGLARR